MPLFRFLFFLESILVSVQNDRGMEVIIMRGEMLIVILNECEGSVPVEGEAVRCHQGNILHSMPLFRFLFFSQRILTPFRMTGVRKGCRLLVSGIKAWGDAGNGTEGRYECLLLSTDFFLYFLYTKGRAVLFL